MKMSVNHKRRERERKESELHSKKCNMLYDSKSQAFRPTFVIFFKKKTVASLHAAQKHPKIKILVSKQLKNQIFSLFSCFFFVGFTHYCLPLY